MRLYIPTPRSNVYRVAGYNPLLQLTQELDELLQPNPTNSTAPVGFLPPLDLSESAQAVQVKVDLPGLSREQIRLSYQDDVLTISGERPADALDNGAGYHRRERLHGRFERSVKVGVPVDASNISASYKDGVLVVTLPKAPEAKPRQIDISTN